MTDILDMAMKLIDAYMYSLSIYVCLKVCVVYWLHIFRLFE